MKKTLTVGEIIKSLEERAPSSASEDWDNTGLLVGDPAWKTSGAIVSVDLTRESIEAAKAKGYRLIVNHHPCIFPRSKGISKITRKGDAEVSTLIFEAIREGIAVASYHTNFDRCSLEVVQAITEGLGAVARGRLLDHPAESLVKLAVFVPESHAEAVRAALCEAGAGVIGNYDFCTFSTTGEGTFRGASDTRPFIGSAGRLERARELRLETILPRGLEPQVLRALRKAHPYEEIAYDLYPLEQSPPGVGLVKGLGYGFWAEFSKPRAFSDLCRGVKSLFNLDGFWIAGKPPARIRKIGFVAGKGGSFLKAAQAVGCDVFITGEAGYHTAMDGARSGMAVVELGHRESEKFYLSTMKLWLSELGLKAQCLDLPTQKIWS